ncbi:ubiquinone biosynthesis protein COQ9, mitochondrial isoform X2 [Tachypleus tridentatus]|uniref:ubiquinone biosynthesis protein COQ9, mitochondrial isoform X2 n=1 Tax=Tachypleus tridentatus TaxID=6853 RepID=UPI003FCF43E9
MLLAGCVKKISQGLCKVRCFGLFSGRSLFLVKSSFFSNHADIRTFVGLTYYHTTKGSLQYPGNANTFSEETEDESHSDREHDQQDQEDEAIKIKILNTALLFVQEHGWTRRALAAGAEQLGLPGVAHGLFPKGGVELINHFYTSSNEELAAQLEVETSEARESNVKLHTDIFLINSLTMRLRMIEPYLDNWPQALAIMSLPQNVPTAFSNLLDLVDIIWFYAGDKSVDFNWYTKRLSLAAVYKATELCFLQDSSSDYVDTWEFLNRRIDDIQYFGKTFKQAQQTQELLAEVTGSGLIVLQNILGLNRLGR